MSDDSMKLVAKVRDWLDRQGYPLEMRVARLFQREQFNVKQAEYYESTEGVWRETDVVAELVEEIKISRSADQYDLLRVSSCAVNECKTSSNRPWIVFTDRSTKTQADTMVFGTIAGTLAQLVMMGIALEFDEPLFHLPIFAERTLGHGVACAVLSDTSSRESNYDSAYKALNQAVDAASAKAESEPGWGNNFRYVFPTVVLSAPLFEAYLDADGNVQIEPCDQIAVMWWVSKRRSDVLVHILTERKLPDYATQLREAFDNLRTRKEQMLEAIKKPKG
jgi:hypothetical protein